MIFRIDTTSSTPVYAQIVEQVKRAAATGALRSGDPLPSLREMAVKLRVNPLTVNKAYKQLEVDGLIETRHGLGSFVTENASSTDGFRREILTKAIDDALVDAYHLGVSIGEFRELVDERIEASIDGFAEADLERSDRDDE